MNANEPNGDQVQDKPVEKDVPIHALFTGTIELGQAKIQCHVLNNGKRVLHQRGMVDALGMARGGSSKGGGDRLAHFVNQKTLNPFVSNKLRDVTSEPILFMYQ